MGRIPGERVDSTAGGGVARRSRQAGLASPRCRGLKKHIFRARERPPRLLAGRSAIIGVKFRPLIRHTIHSPKLPDIFISLTVLPFEIDKEKACCPGHYFQA
eukprot:SAG22_NODE_5119_length_1082_cov_1.508647_2_plen_102_part_00